MKNALIGIVFLLSAILHPAVSMAGYGDSPFVISIAGFLGSDHETSLGVIDTAGAESVRFMAKWGGIGWEQVEYKKSYYDWSETDAKFQEAARLGLDIMVTLYPENPAWQADSTFPQDYPNDMESYLAFVTAAVERYNGDGHQDAPGSPRVSVWEVLVELERGRQAGQIVDPVWWGGTAQEYADLFLRTYRVIKAADPQAIVMPAGVNIYDHVLRGNNRSFTEGVLQGIRGSSMFGSDVVFPYPIHYYPSPTAYPVDNLLTSLNTARQILTASGFGTAPIVISDLGIFVSTNQTGSTREGAAANMILAHAYALAHGVGTIVWAQTSDGDWNGAIEAGLVSRDPTGKWAGIPNVLYYSYRLMSDKLKGTDWSRVSIVAEGQNDVYAYKFPVKNSTRSIYLLSWKKPASSRAQTKVLSLKTLGIRSKVRVTDAVLPTTALANPNLSYPTCFASYIVSGQVSIGTDPVFLDAPP